MSEKHLSAWIRNAALTVAVALPLTAAAQQAYTRTYLNLRAGPDTSYPVVAQLAAGVSVDVLGCLDGYNWCDVTLPDGLRGWVMSNYLDFPYYGTAVPLASYGAMIGVPLITFAIASYWSDHYRNRPWYSEPRWWGGRPPPPPMPNWRPPPRPGPAWQPRPPPPSGWQPPAPRPPGTGWQPRPPGPPGASARPPAPPNMRPPGSPGMGRPPPPNSAPGYRPPQANMPPPAPNHSRPAAPPNMHQPGQPPRRPGNGRGPHEHP